MATNVTKESLSIIQKMNEVWKTTLSWDRYSIYNTISLIHFQHKLNKQKWSGGKGEHLKKMVWMWKPVFHLFVMKIWLKIESGDSTKEWSIKPMIGEEYKKVSIINEHIPKHQVESDNKLKECVSLRNKTI